MLNVNIYEMLEVTANATTKKRPSHCIDRAVTLVTTIDADCGGLDPTWENVETTARFPVNHGDVVVLTCKTNKLQGRFKKSSM